MSDDKRRNGRDGPPDDAAVDKALAGLREAFARASSAARRAGKALDKTAALSDRMRNRGKRDDEGEGEGGDEGGAK